MTLNDLYNQVAKKADVKGTAITVAETKRVRAVFFDQLEDLKPDEAFDMIAMGLKAAKRRRR